MRACTFHSWCWSILRQHYKEAGFAKQPVIWTDSDIKEAVAIAIRRQELHQAADQASRWLGLPEGSSWKQILEEVKRKHPGMHNEAAKYGKNEADK